MDVVADGGCGCQRWVVPPKVGGVHVVPKTDQVKGGRRELL